MSARRNQKKNHKSYSLERRLQSSLDNRRQISTLRSLEPVPVPVPVPVPTIVPAVSKEEETEEGKNDSKTNSNSKSNNSKLAIIDFASNDYLGLGHSKTQLDKVQQRYDTYIQSRNPPYLGSTGSRLLSGNSKLASDLEQLLSKIHSSSSSVSVSPSDSSSVSSLTSPSVISHTHGNDHIKTLSSSSSSSSSALLFNSGYDANLSILSSIPMDNDYIIIDELVHNSLIMGIKMGGRIPTEQVLTFQHNNIQDLKKKLSLLSVIMDEKNENTSTSTGWGEVIIVVESVYSMDGDVAPLGRILDVALEYNARVIIDEAHGLGIFGKTNVCNLNQYDSNESAQYQQQEQKRAVEISGGGGGGTGVLAALNLESHPSILAAVYTFGKAAGCHGSVVIAQEVIIQYLVNYARPFVYSTALPPHSLCTILCAYETMIGEEGELLRKNVFDLVKFFRSIFINELKKSGIIRSDGSGGSDGSDETSFLLSSYSPIQAVMCRGNEHCIRVANMLRKVGSINVFPIRSPTVPKGEERIRIILHAHNNKDEVRHLVQCLCWSMKQSLEITIDRERFDRVSSKL
jgi:8-amino-7-oxononanoate synthase